MDIHKGTDSHTTYSYLGTLVPGRMLLGPRLTNYETLLKEHENTTSTSIDQQSLTTAVSSDRLIDLRPRVKSVLNRHFAFCCYKISLSLSQVSVSSFAAFPRNTRNARITPPAFGILLLPNTFTTPLCLTKVGQTHCCC